MSAEGLMLLVAVTFAAGAAFGRSLFAARGEERLTSEKEHDWRRLDWVKRLDRRRELKRRFIADRGRQSQ